jgi:hypothetical protein
MHSDDSESNIGLLGRGLRREGLVSKTARDMAAGGLNSVLGSADLFGKRKVEGLYFLNKKIAIDGYSFSGCRFDNCTLIVITTNFDISNCIIDTSCTIEYGNEVTKIIQLFNSRFPKAYEYFAQPFVPIRNADGTITITPGIR